jgi:hypothetical protein
LPKYVSALAAISEQKGRGKEGTAKRCLFLQVDVAICPFWQYIEQQKADREQLACFMRFVEFFLNISPL